MTSRLDGIGKGKRRMAEEEQREIDDIIEARAEIRGLIQSGFLDHGQVWTTAWFEFDLKWSDGEQPYITIPKVELEKFVARAKVNAEAFELAKYVAASRIEHGVAIPAGLKELIAHYLTGDFTPASKSRGRKVDTWGRDFIIARTMQILESRWEHRKANRRKNSRNLIKSISEIVHEGLVETEILSVDVERIQRIRSKARKSKSTLSTHMLWMGSSFDAEPELARI